MRKKRHGQSYTRLYRIRNKMLCRTRNPLNHAYKDYGGRGIKVCEEWANDFMAFHEWSMKNGYDDALTIDRIDNDKGYSPENCRWADWNTQGQNKRNAVRLTVNGETKSLKEWSELTGIKYHTLVSRIRNGFPPERTLQRKGLHERKYQTS